jgi:very-short-patch-repair endonuclease
MSDKTIPFEKSFASHEKAIYWSNRNELKPENIYKCTNKLYWFNCIKCNHEFETRINGITTKNKWCPYCSGHKICINDNCILCFEKSFASHEKSKYWSNKNDLNPREVRIGTIYTYIFECDNCKHEFSNSPNNISKGQWCSYCNGNHKMCIDNKCIICFEKSFASHEKSKYWSDKNKITPREVFKGTKNKFIFDCRCGHEIIMSLGSINNGSWCLFCCNQLLCDDKCSICYPKSFASHEKSSYVIDKTINLNKVFKYSSSNRLTFMCNECNLPFNTLVMNVSRGSWCPNCVNKTEKILYKYLITIYINLIQQFKADWCKKKRKLSYDFCIEEYKIIIELDGKQHFEQISNWSSPEEQFENDKYKEICANENGYSIIRLLQEDVFNNKYDWKTELINNIEKIKTDNIIQKIYMCKNNEYENFIN